MIMVLGRANIIPIFRKGKKKALGNYRLSGLNPVPQEAMEEIFLERISKVIKDKKVIMSGQHGFIKGNS